MLSQPAAPQFVPNRPHILSNMAQKCLVIFKLVSLENARNALDQQLRNYTNKANEDVQGFLQSHSPDKGLNHCDHVKSLDAKCQALDKLLVLFEDITHEELHTANPSAENGAELITSDVLRFEPVLQNALTAAIPMTKAVQVQSPPQQPPPPPKQSHNSPPVISSISSGQGDTVNEEAVISSCRNEKEGNIEQKPKAAVKPPTTIKSQKDNIVSVAPVAPSHPKIMNPNPRQILLGRVGHVQHEKQTSSQLLHFLKTSSRNKGAMKLTFIEWKSNNDQQTRHDVAEKLNCVDVLALKRKMLAEMAPVFQLKQIKSSGSVIYTYVNATKTELWDVGDIFTEEPRDSSEASMSERDTGETNQSETSAVSLKAAQTQKSPVITSVDHVCIPELPIKKFEELEVVVSHIVSPGTFYVQHADRDTIMQLQPHISDSWKASSSFAEQNYIPEIGTLVMGWFPKQTRWCRAYVTKICGMSGERTTYNNDVIDTRTDIEVEVKRLDYGDTCCLSLRNITELSPEMLVFPLQAVQVSLANVTPVDGMDWSEEAVDWFRAMVDNRILYARLYPQGTSVMAELFLEKGKLGTMRRGASLSVRLAQNGHAKHDKLKKFDGMKKRGAFKMKKHESAWEEYLVSFCPQK